MIDLEVLTNGLLPYKEGFCFKANEYTYISRSQTGFQSKFAVEPIENEETNANCTISLTDNNLSVFIDNLFIEGNPYFLTQYGTIVDESFPKISGTDSDEFRMLIIPFRDMDKYNNGTHFRMEFIFYKGVLDEIHFVITQRDLQTFQYTEEIVELRGEIRRS